MWSLICWKLAKYWWVAEADAKKTANAFAISCLSSLIFLSCWISVIVEKVFLPRNNLIFFHISAVFVGGDNCIVLTNFCQLPLFLVRIVWRAMALQWRNEMRFSSSLESLNFCKALFLCLIATLTSGHHHGTIFFLNIPLERGTDWSGADKILSLTWETTSSIFWFTLSLWGCSYFYIYTWTSRLYRTAIS